MNASGRAVITRSDTQRRGKGPTGKGPRREFRVITSAGQRCETERKERQLQEVNTGDGRVCAAGCTSVEGLQSTKIPQACAFKMRRPESAGSGAKTAFSSGDGEEPPVIINPSLTAKLVATAERGEVSG